jgi:fructose-1,6-bisphosphatase
MQNIYTQQKTVTQALKAQLKDFGLNPKDWRVKIEGFQIKVVSKDSPSPIELSGKLMTVFTGQFPNLKIQNLELLSF